MDAALRRARSTNSLARAWISRRDWPGAGFGHAAQRMKGKTNQHSGRRAPYGAVTDRGLLRYPAMGSTLRMKKLAAAAGTLRGILRDEERELSLPWDLVRAFVSGTMLHGLP